jgi:hypothetical protein
MAEEGTLGHARAAHYDDEPSKEELQRRMEEARESITQTVTEIKETVTNQYYSVKESVSDALDWRHHFRKRPVAFSVGALSVGFLVGYGIAGAIKGHSDGSRDDYPMSEESDIYARTGARPLQTDEDEAVRHTAFHGHSYAAQPIIDSPSRTSDEEYAQATFETESERGGSPTHGGSYSYSASPQKEEEEPGNKKPGLFERFKETSAYDRLQAEVGSLGERFIEELSKTAQQVVLPALFGKIKELFGVDLSNKQAQGRQTQSSSGGNQTRQTSRGAQQAASTQTASAASTSSSAPAARGSSYGTSENRGYGSQSSERATGGGNDSVLDLDR